MGHVSMKPTNSIWKDNFFYINKRISVIDIKFQFYCMAFVRYFNDILSVKIYIKVNILQSRLPICTFNGSNAVFGTRLFLACYCPLVHCFYQSCFYTASHNCLSCQFCPMFYSSSQERYSHSRMVLEDHRHQVVFQQGLWQ